MSARHISRRFGVSTIAFAATLAAAALGGCSDDDADAADAVDGALAAVAEPTPVAWAYTGQRFEYALDARGTNLGDFILYNATEDIVIERDPSQGDLNGFKKLFRVRLGAAGAYVGKAELVDLMKLRGPNGISGSAGAGGDVGLGDPFAMPFNTIEDVLVLDARTLLVIDDNNFPFSIGRHVGAKTPDDSEFVQIRLPQALDLAR